MISSPTSLTGPRPACLALLFGLSLLPLAGHADTPEATLRDAWLQQAPLPAGGYAFRQRAQDVAHYEQQGRELQAELGLAARHAAERGEPLWANAFASWERRVAAYRQRPDRARSPGRADLTALVASPRHDPSLAELARFGACHPPAWVEVWHIGGVTRLTYRPGMTVAQALDEATDGQAHRQVDTAWRISPLGRVDEVGIAAWNHQGLEATPGSRVMQRLPNRILEDDELGGARWIDATLPHYLATRLPGDTCTLYSLSAPTDDQ